MGVCNPLDLLASHTKSRGALAIPMGEDHICRRSATSTTRIPQPARKPQPRDRNNAEDVDTHSDDHMGDAWRYGMVHIYKPYRVEKPQLAGTGQELINEMAAMVRGGQGRYGGNEQ